MISKVFLEATNNLEWLKSGERVLLKPALNSKDKYPATTHPLALEVVAKEIRMRGGVPIAADQSGIETVVVDKREVRKGSSRECYRKSDMKVSGVDFIALEERGWDSYKFVKNRNSDWSDGFYISDIIDSVDHIINLPRISTHIQAGVTLGAKNWVGLLREDSRLRFHSDGPYYKTMVKFASASPILKTNLENEDKFFEKMGEITLAVKSKLRLTLFVGTEVQLVAGPDKKVAMFKTLQKKPKVGVVIASDNQMEADAVALAFLRQEYRKLNFIEKIPAKIIGFLNKQTKELIKERFWDNAFLKYAISKKLGKKNFTLLAE
ncbi:MAG: DUF362 domain-containing protein, partial [Desulfobacterales bacterium]|nr:DUF362 domain-containing protein [Desulfobacterales bacterium]